jgi:intein/homing endonuclease
LVDFGSCSCWNFNFRCFVEGTRVEMFDGSEKSIEDVKIGDEVLSYDFENGENVLGTVGQVFVHDYDGEILNINGLEVTPEHPIFIEGKWKLAGEVEVGDLLQNSDGVSEEVESISREVVRQKVYNLEIGGAHNYYAGGILVHNKPIATETLMEVATSPPSERNVFKKVWGWGKRLFS